MREGWRRKKCETREKSAGRLAELDVPETTVFMDVLLRQWLIRMCVCRCESLKIYGANE